jgi:hypothetical protein
VADTRDPGGARDARDDAGTAACPAGDGLVRSLLAGPALGPLRGLLLTLRVVTGVVDAVSILRLARP